LKSVLGQVELKSVLGQVELKSVLGQVELKSVLGQVRNTPLVSTWPNVISIPLGQVEIRGGVFAFCAS